MASLGHKEVVGDKQPLITTLPEAEYNVTILDIIYAWSLYGVNKVWLKSISGFTY